MQFVWKFVTIRILGEYELLPIYISIKIKNLFKKIN